MGELAVGRCLPCAGGGAGRSGCSAPGPHVGAVGRGRVAGDLLLRRGAGAQARVRRRRPARPASRRVAGRGCSGWDGAAGADLRGGRCRRGWWRCGGLGGADGDRHRVRAGGARGDQHSSAGGVADLPAHPRRGRRPVGDRDHRGVLHGLAGAGAAAARTGPAGSVRGAGAASGAVVVAAAAAGDPDLGAGARVGGARHRGGGVARVRGAGGAPFRGPGSGAGRAFRAPVPAVVGGGGRAGVRVLRRRGVGGRGVGRCGSWAARSRSG